jgi:hypothetical protein
MNVLFINMKARNRKRFTPFNKPVLRAAVSQRRLKARDSGHRLQGMEESKYEASFQV